MKYLILTFFSGVSLLVVAQVKPIYYSTEDDNTQLLNDIQYLASDDLLGRLPGTEGATLAIEYIENSFQNLGLKPLFSNNSFLQSFNIPRPSEFPKNQNYIVIGNDTLKPENGLIRSPYSISKEFSGWSLSLHPKTQGSLVQNFTQKSKTTLKGKLVIIEIFDKRHKKKNTRLSSILQDEILEAQNRGAEEVILIAKHNKKEVSFSKNMFSKLKNSNINISICFNRKWSRRLLRNKKSILSMTKVSKRQAEGQNIGGVLDFGAKTTVLIGAHYDHLGTGQFHGNTSKEIEIYNGADDNASGVGVMLEVVRQVKTETRLQDKNIVFVAFSGEEDGLIGSNFFVKNCPFDPKTISFMLNIDMVGRLNNSDSLIIYGTSSSSEWDELINGLSNVEINIKNVADTFPRSDHASFIKAGIPSVMFHTGLHKDYHKPSDDFDKIDPLGLVKITGVILEILESSSKFKRFIN